MSDTNNLKIFSFNSYARIILPILDGMDWHGDQDSLIEALPYDIDQMDIEDFFNTMANLGFLAKETDTEETSLNEIIFPALWIKDEASPIALIKKMPTSALVYIGTTGEYKQISLSDIKGKLLSLTPIKDEREQLQKESQSWFWWILKRFRSTILIAFILTFFLSILSVLSPLMIMDFQSNFCQSIIFSFSNDGMWNGYISPCLSWF